MLQSLKRVYELVDRWHLNSFGYKISFFFVLSSSQCMCISQSESSSKSESQSKSSP